MTAMKLNASKLQRMSWARSKQVCDDSQYLAEILPKHIISRYYRCLEKGYLTEDIDFIFQRTFFLTYSATCDFKIHNVIGYFLKVFDSQIGEVSLDPSVLDDKLKRGQEDWGEARRLITLMLEGWENSDKKQI